MISGLCPKMEGLRHSLLFMVIALVPLVTCYQCRIKDGVEANPEDEGCETYWLCRHFVGVSLMKCPDGGQVDFNDNKCKANGDVWCQLQHQRLEEKRRGPPNQKTVLPRHGPANQGLTMTGEGGNYYYVDANDDGDYSKHGGGYDYSDYNNNNHNTNNHNNNHNKDEGRYDDSDYNNNHNTTNNNNKDGGRYDDSNYNNNNHNTNNKDEWRYDDSNYNNNNNHHHNNNKDGGRYDDSDYNHNHDNDNHNNNHINSNHNMDNNHHDYYHDIDQWTYVCRTEWGHEPNLADHQCRTYWRCDHFKGSLVQCKPGLMYDYSAKACVHRRHVGCQEQHHRHVTNEPKHRVEVKTNPDGSTTLVHHYYYDNQ